MKYDKAIVRWLYLGMILIFLMVIIGGITRLTQSGLSIVEWKPVTGTLPPLSEIAWQAEFDNYKLSPEFTAFNSDFELQDFKNIYWWEYLHRLLARLIGLVFMVPFIYFLVKKRFNKALLRRVAVVPILGALQGFIGWYMVKSGLVDNPHVSHFRLALHLCTAMLLMNYLYWIILKEQSVSLNNQKTASPLMYKLLKYICVLIFIQIIYGAFTAGLKAGYMYNTFPKMSGEWLPGHLFYDFSLNGIFSLISYPATVQYTHRVLGTLVLIFSILITVRLFRTPLLPEQKTSVLSFVGIICTQYLLGIITLLYFVPLSVGVTHQAVAIVLLLAGQRCLFVLKGTV